MQESALREMVAGPTLGPSIHELRTGYRDGTLTPRQVVDDALGRIAERGEDGTWISVVARDDLMARVAQLEQHRDPASLPLFGVPFGVKDSIDVAGVVTTVACPELAYNARTTAEVVQRLLDAGAVFVGKTNLDQLATGLNGTRTPYPLPRSVFGRDLISGGSSSGSALAVATGEVPFAVATDTAGSGRVPPALNGIPGFKPSRGLISTVGLVPACRSLDCVSIVAGRVADLAAVLDVVAAVDERDPYSRPRRREVVDTHRLRVGLPGMTHLEFFGDEPMQAAHVAARGRVAARFERRVQVPLTPFLDAGALLYSGPWVAERLTEFGDLMAARPDALLPVIRSILASGSSYSATDVFAAEHRLGELKTVVAGLWHDMDVLVLPALGTTFTVEQVLADPVRANTVLGHYTHFGNLLDLCAAVVPADRTSDGRPAALMVLGPALADDRVLAVAAALSEPEESLPAAAGATPDTVGTATLVVAGHHLSGQPRSADLVERGGVLTASTATAPVYRLLRLGGAEPVPGLVRVPTGGAAVEVETWTLPAAALAELLSGAAPSVCLGRVELADGSCEIGFVADAAAANEPDAVDITSYGGWRTYLSSTPSPPLQESRP